MAIPMVRPKHLRPELAVSRPWLEYYSEGVGPNQGNYQYVILAGDGDGSQTTGKGATVVRVYGLVHADGFSADEMAGFWQALQALRVRTLPQEPGWCCDGSEGCIRIWEDGEPMEFSWLSMPAREWWPMLDFIELLQKQILERAHREALDADLTEVPRAMNLDLEG